MPKYRHSRPLTSVLRAKGLCCCQNIVNNNRHSMVFTKLLLENALTVRVRTALAQSCPLHTSSLIALCRKVCRPRFEALYEISNSLPVSEAAQLSPQKVHLKACSVDSILGSKNCTEALRRSDFKVEMIMMEFVVICWVTTVFNFTRKDLSHITQILSASFIYEEERWRKQSIFYFHLVFFKLRIRVSQGKLYCVLIIQVSEPS